MGENENRLYLHYSLVDAFPGVSIYYRPPGNLLIQRPCVIYEPKTFEPSYANSQPYVVGTLFQVTLLSDLPGFGDKSSIFSIPGVVVRNNNTYVMNDIVHDVFELSVNSIT